MSIAIRNIHGWNEWIADSGREPGTVHGMKYLEAIRDVFGDSRQNAGTK